MLYRRSGFPEEDEIVLCQVTNIFPNSVFVELLEYAKQGMVHISEVSPGRIRNLRDFVSIGRQIVCKVLRIDREKGHIDLSLRRANAHQRQEKLDEIKQELNAEGVVKNLAKRQNRPVESLYAEISKKIFPEYSHLYLCFKRVAAKEVDLVEKGWEPKMAQELTAAIQEKFKLPKIVLGGEIRLETYHSDGVEKVKSVLQEIEKISPQINLFYLGGGRYKLAVEEADYKSAEKTLEKVEGFLEKFKDKISQASFEREKKD